LINIITSYDKKTIKGILKSERVKIDPLRKKKGNGEKKMQKRKSHHKATRANWVGDFNISLTLLNTIFRCF
jgi:hypothetical protein